MRTIHCPEAGDQVYIDIDNQFKVDADYTDTIYDILSDTWQVTDKDMNSYEVKWDDLGQRWISS